MGCQGYFILYLFDLHIKSNLDTKGRLNKYLEGYIYKAGGYTLTLNLSALRARRIERVIS